MLNSIRNSWPIILLFVFLTAIHCFLVFDRIVAAGWAWYKFKDHGGNGYIMLSQETAVWFVAFSIGIIIAGFGIGRGRLALKEKVIKAAQWLMLSNIVFYLFLAFSPLNQWR